MCGVVGVLMPENVNGSMEMERVIARMTESLAHRGPDDSGTWIDEDKTIALGHRRLSIIDTSEAGRQPMHSACGRFVISYNGEVYNFKELRDDPDIKGYGFKGNSDTEVILAAFTRWGVEESIKKFIGMFAIAVWDREERSLHLIRDRLGIKPLYYGWAGGSFVFGSEMKAICANPEFRRELNTEALALYLRFGYIPAPYSIYRGINVLKPGYILVVDNTSLKRRDPRLSAYWTAFEVVEKGKSDPFAGSEEEAEEELDRILRDSVKLRMISDVPLGAFLSGGIDSSTVVSLMQAQSTRKVRTYSIGFKEDAYNEAVYAKKVARHLGTDHTELYLTPGETMEVIPKLPELYDEPFADSSQIPTHIISWLTRRHETVALSGDGGDELFCGYPVFLRGSRDWDRISRIPLPLRRAVSRGILSLSEGTCNRLMRPANAVLARRGTQLLSPGEALHRLASSLPAAEFYEYNNIRYSMSTDPGKLLLGGADLRTVITGPGRKPRLELTVEQMMYWMLKQYLVDDILTKVDRASMGVSLEVRVPILDHRVVEFAWRLPFSMKCREGKTKWLLRRVLNRYVPEELIDRPKMGFAVPVGSWLRGPLRDWAEDLLDPKTLRADGIFRIETVRRIWGEHISGAIDHHLRIWYLLMFQAWRKRWLS